MLKTIAKFDAQALSERFPEFNQLDIDSIKSWLKKSLHLPRITDYEIFLFLHASHFSVEACKIRIDKFYTMRTHLKVIFEDRDVAKDEIRFYHEDYVFWKLPKKTTDGKYIFISKILNPNRFNFKMILKLMSFAGEVELWSNSNEICDGGYIFLVDLEHSRMAHLTQIDFVLNKHMLTYTAEAFPFRLGAVHYINVPSHMGKILNIVKSCLSQEITDKFHIYNSVHDLPATIPKAILPRDYEGGQEKSISELNDAHYDFLLNHREYFLEEAKIRRVNERLRLGKPSSELNLFGMEGNFKKLDID
uniref:CSON010940 protein n=1 Tax=Culicoides sonorensis TaxID=179676 RepID=A0A336M2W0_CULSO